MKWIRKQSCILWVGRYIAKGNSPALLIANFVQDSLH